MLLEMTCDRCSVAQTCPKNGASPLFLSGGKRAHCRIVGGYGRTPVDPEILSSESRQRAEKDGPCLTIAEVPALEDGIVVHEVVKIFSPPVLSERERPTAVLGGQLNPKGF
jgi:hypothetical protein